MIALANVYYITGKEKYLEAIRNYLELLEGWEKIHPLLSGTGFCIAICLTGVTRYHQITGDEKAKKTVSADAEKHEGQPLFIGRNSQSEND